MDDQHTDPLETPSSDGHHEHAADARQQAVIAGLGQLALAGAELQELFDETARQAAAGAGTPLCELLELSPAGDGLLLRAGHGWREGLVGHATVPAGAESQAGYTLRARGPVVVEDLDRETRFRPSALLNEHGAKSGISVVIGPRDEPWGVLGVHAREIARYDERDVNFLQSAANVLGEAIARRRAEDGLKRRLRELRLLHRATAMAATTDSVDEVLQGCVDIVCEAASWPIGHAYLRSDDDPARLVSSEIWHIENGADFEALRRATADVEFAPGEAFLGRIWSSGEPAWLTDLGDPAVFKRRQLVELGLRGAFGFPIRVRDDTVAVLEFFSFVDQEPDEHLLQVVGDVGEQIGRVIERRRAEEKLREADRRKDEFLALLGHELRNPLAALTSGVEMLTQGVSPRASRWAQRMMSDQLTLLVRLVNDLLDLNRISRGKISLTRRPARVDDVVQAAVDSIRPSLKEKEHQLVVRIEQDVPAIEVDAARVEQLLGNLLSNAARYTQRGGRIELAAWTENRDLMLTVIDDGRGIEPGEIETIFEAFAQGEGADSGLGIGLTLVRQLAELHGGRVEVESEGAGRGSRFTVVLPVVTEGLARVVSSAPEAVEAPCADARVLVVDDNVDAATALGQLLEMKGYCVTLAFTGGEALKAVDEERPDVILLDLGLPDVDGYEVARELRRRDDCPRLVALTGYGHEEAKRKVAEAGIDHHLLKPVEYPALLELLATLTRSRAAP